MDDALLSYSVGSLTLCTVFFPSWKLLSLRHLFPFGSVACTLGLMPPNHFLYVFKYSLILSRVSDFEVLLLDIYIYIYY